MVHIRQKKAQTAALKRVNLAMKMKTVLTILILLVQVLSVMMLIVKQTAILEVTVEKKST